MNVEMNIPQKFKRSLACLMLTAFVGLLAASYLGGITFMAGMNELVLLMAFGAVFLWFVVFLWVTRGWEIVLRIGVFTLFFFYSLFAMTVFVMSYQTVFSCQVRETVSNTEQIYYCQYRAGNSATFKADVNTITLELIE